MHNSNHGTRSLFSCAACANRFSSSSILSSISCSPSYSRFIQDQNQQNTTTWKSVKLTLLDGDRHVQHQSKQNLRLSAPSWPSLSSTSTERTPWSWLGMAGTSIPVPLQQTNLSSAKSLLCCSAFKLWMCALSLSTCPGLYIINHISITII